MAHDVSPNYKEHLSSHKKIHRVNRKTGRDLYEWVRIKSRADHLYDCETYLSGFAVFGKIIKPTGSMDVDSLTPSVA